MKASERIRAEKVDIGLLALCAYVLRQMKAGADQVRICKALTHAGMTMADARALVTKIQSEIGLPEEGRRA